MHLLALTLGLSLKILLLVLSLLVVYSTIVFPFEISTDGTRRNNVLNCNKDCSPKSLRIVEQQVANNSISRCSE